MLSVQTIASQVRIASTGVQDRPRALLTCADRVRASQELSSCKQLKALESSFSRGAFQIFVSDMEVDSSDEEQPHAAKRHAGPPTLKAAAARAARSRSLNPSSAGSASSSKRHSGGLDNIFGTGRRTRRSAGPVGKALQQLDGKRAAEAAAVRKKTAEFRGHCWWCWCACEQLGSDSVHDPDKCSDRVIDPEYNGETGDKWKDTALSKLIFDASSVTGEVWREVAEGHEGQRAWQVVKV